VDDELRHLVAGLTYDEIQELVDDLPPPLVSALLSEVNELRSEKDLPGSPLALARSMDDGFVTRPHLDLLDKRIAQAVRDVENGQNRRLIVEMPPRSGKSTTASLYTPAWVMQRHPSWPIVLTSYDDALAVSWGRQIRRWVESGALGDVRVAKDAGAASAWETTAGGQIRALSIRQALTGYGAKCLVVDDPHKDFIEAHSKTVRDNVWNWWLSVAQTRLEQPYLVIVVQTRWTTDDLVGRLLSSDYEGDSADWEEIRFPAIAEQHDVLGREPGDPLFSPLLVETRDEALQRWTDTQRSVGSYVWSAEYQQRPAPAKGEVFSTSWWRFWTTDPNRATEDGRVVYLDPLTLASGRWLDSWDMAFKATQSSDYVVGQRWVRVAANRYLIAQSRGRRSFTQTIAAMEAWADPESEGGTGRLVHERVVEEAANGAAVIDSLQQKISGLRPCVPRGSKEVRARLVTPEIESGNVYLPHPADRGHEWVEALLSELRQFPHDAHDDCVDGLTQALSELRDVGRGGLTVPGRSAGVPTDRDRIKAAHTDLRRPLAGQQKIRYG
jgi:predicted phage terminase large subunit-like protein